MRPFTPIVLVLGLASPLAAGAQACLGRPSFATGAKSLTGGYRDGPGQDVYVGEFVYGTVQSAFGGVQDQLAVSRNVPAGGSSRENLLSGFAGAQMETMSQSGAQVCPFGGLGFISGSSRIAGTALDWHGVQYEAGAAMGLRTGRIEEVHLIPSLAAKLVGSHVSGTRTAGGSSFSYTSRRPTYGLAILSLGIAQRAFALTPFVQFPFATQNSNSTWGVTASYMFGAPKR